MIPLCEARRLISELVRPRPALATPLAAAQGGVLAEPAVADAFYPAGDRATMDGYVIAEDAPAGRFRVVGEIQAGHVPTRALESGKAMRIFTGALLPAGGGRVVMQEQAQRDGDFVTIDPLPEPRFVRPHGSEARPGDIVLPAGTRLGAAELAILAQIGHVTPRVIHAPLVRHIATGSELVAPEATPAAGQIRDTNSTLLAALFADLGVDVLTGARGIDDPAVLTALGREPADLLLISGGASVGAYDFGAETLRRLGFTIHFDKVNLRPGKPLTFATRGEQVAFVIPGNPVSHFVTFQVAIRLAVERLLGREPAWNFLRLELRGGEPLRPDPRETYSPARVFAEAGRLFVAPKRWSTSGDNFSLAGTNALVRFAADSPADGFAETLLLDLPAPLGCPSLSPTHSAMSHISKVARLTLSDRASAGIYEDRSGPEIERVFTAAGVEVGEWVRVVMPDDHSAIEALLRRLADEDGCDLILTTGGTGPARRDVTPEATRAVLERELPGFGEIMRVTTFPKVPTAILSRSTAGTRGRTLIVNLPGNPKAIGECLPLVVPAIREALRHLLE